MGVQQRDWQCWMWVFGVVGERRFSEERPGEAGGWGRGDYYKEATEGVSNPEARRPFEAGAGSRT